MKRWTLLVLLAVMVPMKWPVKTIPGMDEIARVPIVPNSTTDNRNTSSLLHFAPGSLNLSRLETFRQCYTDPQRYHNHFRSVSNRPALCSFSTRYNLLYNQVEKSGSSTTRIVMRCDFAAQEMRSCLFSAEDPDATTRGSEQLRRLIDPGRPSHFFTSFREPTSRFLSSYQEMLKRWMMIAPSNRTPHTPHSFSLPFANMTQRTRSSLMKAENEMHFEIEKQAFEQFVHDYDAAKPWDNHLRIQVTSATNEVTGRSFQGFDQIVDTHMLTAGLRQLSHKLRNGNDTISVEKHANPGGLKLSVSQMSVLTRRKICQLTAQDYCCLNYPLPSVCAGAVECRWIPNTFSQPAGDGGGSPKLLIEAVSPYPATETSG